MTACNNDNEPNKYLTQQEADDDHEEAVREWAYARDSQVWEAIHEMPNSDAMDLLMTDAYKKKDDAELGKLVRQLADENNERLIKLEINS